MSQPLSIFATRRDSRWMVQSEAQVLVPLFSYLYSFWSATIVGNEATTIQVSSHHHRLFDARPPFQLV